MDQNLNLLCFYENVEEAVSFCGQNILIRGVFVTQLSTNATISLTNCVWYDILRTYEHCAVLVWQFSEHDSVFGRT
jgi:hypothetical protein